MTTPSRRVFVLEDNPSTREWLVTVADIAFPNCIVSTAATLEAGFEWLKQQPLESAPVCLVDLGLPDGSGVDFIRALLRTLPAARPIVTTLYDDDDHLLSAMAAGAQGYLLKDQTAEELGDRLRKMDGGEVPLAPAMAARIFKLFQPQAAFIAAHAHQAVSLTEREGEVLRLIGRGLTNAEAARILSISPQTVASHIKHIYAKLDIGSRAEAATEALRRGLA